MAYIDQRTGRNQRAAVMATVALLQGGMIIALINGLAVHFIKAPPIPNPQASDVPITVSVTPPQPQPSARPEVTREHVDLVKPTIPGLNDGASFIPDIAPPPFPSQPGGEVTYVDPPPPQPPAFPPRGARPHGNPGLWASTGDYPARDLREGNQGVARFSLAIGTDGKVRSCTVTTTSGFSGLDKATCDNVSRRARFEPATDGSGNRVPGTYSGSIRWVIPQD